MGRVSNEAIFCVRAAGADHWVVFRDTCADPLASFDDKASALAYALHVARRRSGPTSMPGFGANLLGGPAWSAARLPATPP
jgi:hypothetical protein